MNNRLAVDIVLPSFSVGGAERVTLALARALDPAEFDVRLIALSAHGGFTELANELPDVVDLGQPRLRSALFSLAKTIRQRNPALVFSSQAHLNIALLMMTPFLGGARHVFREANMPSLCLASGHWPKSFGWAYRRLAHRACYVFATSNQMAEEFATTFGVNRESLGILCNPVDVGTIRAAAEPAIRKQGAGRRFVAAGRLVRQKGFDRLVEWMVDSRPDDHLTILGEGPDRPDLEAQIAKMNLANRVSLAGHSSTPWPYFSGSDAVLLSSRWEGLPNVALEALACGTPVIATPESGGISDIEASAPDRAVVIASAGAVFVSAMNDVQPGTHRAARPSLLPDSYTLDTVGDVFASKLKTAAA